MAAMGETFDRPVVADCRRCLRILEWRLLIFRLRKGPQVWPKDNKASVPIESLLTQINADAVCLVRTQFQQLRIGLGR
jgi:hypothetical protein